MAKINEEIVGGLISALTRGENLEKAMMTFYNAGYEKEEIEDSARDVYNKLGAKAMGIDGSLQEALDGIAFKAGAISKKEDKKEESGGEETTDDGLNLKPIPEKKEDQMSAVKKAAEQVVSIYGSDANPSQYQNANDLANKIEEAIKGLKPVSIPSKIEIVHKNEDNQPTTVVQNVSSYGDQRVASKAVTYMLVFILILLLGALVAVFLFKDDLIKLFNEFGFG